MCPVCNKKVIKCRDVSCKDCIYNDDDCDDDCECNPEDVITELHSQLIQSKIEMSHLIATHIKVS